jgi:hypothetical protein
MTRPLERVNQLDLLPTGDGWETISAPRTRDEPADTNNYAAQWRSFVAAAREAGWTPDDVRRNGTEALAQALTVAGLRDWAPATVTRYAKLARYAGVDPAPHPPPSTAPLDEVNHHLLWHPRHHPVSQRNALAAVLTWHTTLPLPQLLALHADQLAITPTGGLTIDHDNGPLTAPIGGQAADRWSTTRCRYTPGPWLFCTTHPSNNGNPPGSRLSIRGFQASFALHCALAGHADLTWRRYHALADRSREEGDDPSATGSVSGRSER